MPTNFGGFEVSDCKQYHNRLMLSKETRKSPPPAFGSNFGVKEAVVSSVTMESLVNEHALTSLHAIKLDCEGAEYLALQGGLQALKQFSPAIFFEDNDAAFDVKSSATKYAPTSKKCRACTRSCCSLLDTSARNCWCPCSIRATFEGSRSTSSGRRLLWS